MGAGKEEAEENKIFQLPFSKRDSFHCNPNCPLFLPHEVTHLIAPSASLYDVKESESIFYAEDSSIFPCYNVILHPTVAFLAPAFIQGIFFEMCGPFATQACSA